MPPTPRLFFALSIVASIQSLAALLFFVIPRVLIPLPLNVRKRSYQYAQIVQALIGVIPLAFVGMFLLLAIFPIAGSPVGHGQEDDTTTVIFTPVVYLFLISLSVPLIMAGMLWLSPGMYRWAGPGGAGFRRRPHFPETLPTVHPTRIFVEYMRQDRAVARELRRQIQKAGHQYVDDPEQADIVLTLLSRFNTTSQFDPETTPLIPVVLQSCDVDPRLSRLQWIDLRQGLRHFERAAGLLAEPALLIQALGVLPIRESARAVQPPAVRWVSNYFWLIVAIKGMVAVAAMWGAGEFVLLYANRSLLDRLSEFLGSLLTPSWLLILLLTATAVFVAVAATRSLANREGFFKSPFGLLLALMYVSMLAFPLWLGLTPSEDEAFNWSVLGSLFIIPLNCVWASPAGIVLMVSRDMRLWMARRDDSPIGGHTNDISDMIGEQDGFSQTV